MKNLIILLLIAFGMNASAQTKKDTLVVPVHVKVVVIDGIAYDVIRTTELKKAEPVNIWGGFRGSGITIDTISWQKNNFILQGYAVPNLNKYSQ